VNADDLVRLRLEMEFGDAPLGETLPPATVNLDGQPRLVVSRHREGEAMFFRHDVPEETREQIRQIGVVRGLVDEEDVRRVLGHVEHVWRVRWYTVDRKPEPEAYPDVVLRDGRHVVLIDGEVAAQAWTTAESSRAVEVEVETHPNFRRRGLAIQVVSAWSAAELGCGRVAFYSHVKENDASAGVARHLGLHWLSDEVEFL
jgi:predicted GNAT family acetyltransferase